MIRACTSLDVRKAIFKLAQVSHKEWSQVVVKRGDEWGASSAQKAKMSDHKEVFIRATGASPRRLGKQIILAVANNTRSWGKEKTHTDIDAFGVPQKHAMLC